MEQSRKNLKILSIVMVVFAVLTLLSLVTELIFGNFNDAVIPEGSPDNILLITKIFVAVISFAFLLPQIYVGIKGLKMAKNPDSSKGHIIWATILLVISVIGLVSPIVSIIKLEAIFENISTIITILVDVVIYYLFIKYAKIVAKEN